MTPDEVYWLAGFDGQRLLADLPPYRPADALPLSERLHRDGWSAWQVAAALTQSRLRTRVAQRWGAAASDLAHRLLFTLDGAEQATRPAVAALRAQRFTRFTQGLSRELGVSDAPKVADLGCGIGLDALALAEAGLAVDAFERDATTAAVARVNAAATGLAGTVTVTETDVTAVASDRWTPDRWMQYAAVYVDPARRRDGRRLMNPEHWSPSLSWVLQLQQPNLVVKVAPGLDHARVPADMEFAVVSDAGSVVEAGLYRGVLRQPGVSRSATLLPALPPDTTSDTTSDTTPPPAVTLTNRDLPSGAPPVRPVGGYLHEPDGAAIRAGLIGALVARHNAWLIDSQVAYLSSDEPIESPWLSSYQVHDAMPFSLKRLRAYLREHHVGHVVVKKRASAIDVDQLRNSLRLRPDAPERRTVFVTRRGADPVVLITSPK